MPKRGAAQSRELGAELSLKYIMKILVAEPLAPAGDRIVARAQPGWDIIVSNPKEYAQHLADCDALLVRSAVQVTKAVLAKAPKLRVIGRAGVGVDNVDLRAATAAGVLVMNTPGGNAISVAEHTLALMLAMARAHPAGQRFHASGQVGKEEVPGQRTARQDAGRRRPGQHRPRSGEARARLRDADRGARSVRDLRKCAQRSGRGTGVAAGALRSRATTSRCTLPLTPETDRHAERATPSRR